MSRDISWLAPVLIIACFVGCSVSQQQSSDDLEAKKYQACTQAVTALNISADEKVKQLEKCKPSIWD